jgi:hypothetical protein
MREVHAIKDAIGAKYGNNLDALFQEIQLGEARLKATGVQILPPPANQTNSTRHCSGRASLTAEFGRHAPL